MKLNNLNHHHKNRQKTRIARGVAGKGGKTGGRGTKGQKARTGYNLPHGFEGGQTKLIQRLPKTKGFKSNKIKNIIVKSSIINKYFGDKEEINPKTLTDKKIIKDLKPHQQIKILFDKPFDKTYHIKDCLMSKKVQNLINKK
ncbi:MAG: 50S ribosomal protein L15 [Bacteroidales bacterium]|nr:50S ribosomal protein L15 [Bacteroidales bacterium]